MDPLRHILAIAMALSADPLVAQTLLSVGSTPAYPGATVNVPVNLAHATNVVAAQFDVAYDASRVSSSAVVPDPHSTRHTVVSREIAPGLRRVLVFSRQNAAITNRSPVSVPFTLSSAEYNGSGPLTPSNAILARNDATAVDPLSLISGTIFVRSVYRFPDGHVQFFLPATPDQRYYVQASSDLEQWVNISTNVAAGTFMDLVDVDAASFDYRFYRWQEAD